MPNWCNTSLVFKGDKQEIKTLYQTMKRLERRKKPLVENGFGTNWLGSLSKPWVAIGKKPIAEHMAFFGMSREYSAYGNRNCLVTLHRNIRLHLSKISITELLLPLRRTDDGGIPD